MGSILGGIMGGGSSPGQDAQMQGLKATQQDLQAYRPEAMQSRLNALSNMSTAYQGANNALETLWGAPQGGPQTAAQKLNGGFGPPPQRMMGHEMPQGAFPGPMTSQQASAAEGHYTKKPQEYDPVSQLMDPLNIFGGW